MKINEKIKQIIETNPIAFATASESGPYVIAVACCRVLNGEQILITNNYMQRTIENIQKNPKVALVVWNKKWEGYQFLGTCQYFEKGEWADYVKNLKENKNLPAKGALLVSVEEIIESK